jgi:thioredoxin 1
VACDGGDPGKRAAASAGAVTQIRSMDHFNRVVDSAGDRLLVFDLYADWCFPCKELEPILEEIARENDYNSDFYRIDMESLGPVADIFKVRGIPHVAFVKERTIVFSLMGLHPKGKYTEVIHSLTR